MEIKYLGTAAYEGIPSLFCNCDVCKRSRKSGGKAIRSRSQAIIDGKLLLDFNGDTLMHFQNYSLDIQNIKTCLITHAHSDHLYSEDINMIGGGYAHPKKDYTFSVYGSDTVIENIKSRMEDVVANDPDSALRLNTVEAFQSFNADGYSITAYPAFHDPCSGPLFYSVSDGKKTMLYAHDTGYFFENVWEHFKKTKPHFDLVSMDCTSANMFNGATHMGLPQNIQIKEKMIKEGYADEKTVFIANHFSHNAKDVFYDDFMPIALKSGILTSYDGMTVEF